MTETNNHADRGHSPYGPSALKYLAACSGWQSRGGTSAAADKGTRIHEAVEVRNPAGLKDEEEMSLYEQLVEAEDRWLATLFTEAEPEVHKEVSLDIELPYDCSTYGTSDLIAVAGTVALCLDYKTGVSEIDEVVDNDQSKAYSIGVFQKYPEVETIHAVFLVPARNQELHGIYTRDMLDDMMEAAAQNIIRAKIVRMKRSANIEPDLTELNPNNGCSYCMHASTCAALGNGAYNIASRYEPEWIPAGPVHSTEIDDPDTLAKFYVIASILDKWVDGIKRKAVLSALDGLAPTGFKLRSMGCTKKVTDAPAFIKLAQDELELDPAELMQFADFPVAKVRDYYATKAPRGKKKVFAERFEEAVSLAVESSTERFTLQKDNS